MSPKSKKIDKKLSDKLYRRRAALFARLEKFSEFLKNLELTQTTVSELRIRLVKVKDAWEEFESVQSEIDNLIDDPEQLAEEDEVRDDFENKYYSIVGLGEEFLSRATPAQLPSSVTPSTSNAQVSHLDVRLPPITLPIYSGEFDQWTSFFSTFKELVHENQLYQDPLKFKYLKGSLRVSYGNSSASWLSTRTLQQLSFDNPHPRVSEIIRENFYVDDLICGCDTVEEAISIYHDLSQHLGMGGFNIRKWSSSSSEFIHMVPECDRGMQLAVSFDDEASSSVQTLGMVWLPLDDCFSFAFQPIDLNDCENKFTKRRLLSTIAKLFDPLGLLGPVIVKAKILMQELWRLDYDWDEPLSHALALKWKIFARTLANLKDLRIPRQILINGPIRIEIHGFADASTVAYGACIYFRSIDNSGNILARLVTSKSRVAPLKQLTLPRLELQAAVLLINLVDELCRSYSKLTIDSIKYYTDSRVVLAWIGASPSKWTTFVANRVARIQESSNPAQWQHVSSTLNPADYVSRGLYIDELVASEQWWNGPSWLSQNEDHVCLSPIAPLSDEEVPDRRKPQIAALASSLPNVPSFVKLISNCSSFSKLVRVVAYCYRFVKRRNIPLGSRPIGPITGSEFGMAKIAILRIAQQHMFQEDYCDLRN
ncbi:unnamed protein product, partial [Nesidiocoris tenuis]